MKPQNKKAVKPIDFTALRLFNLSNYIFFRFAQEIAHTQNIFFASLKKIVSLGNYKYHELKFL